MLNNFKFMLIAVTFIFCGTYTSAETKLKTSSLSITKVSKSNTLSSTCAKMFKEGDKLISDAEKQPGTHIQLSQMRNKLLASKQQILKMDLLMQEKSCDKGLTALNQLKHQY